MIDPNFKPPSPQVAHVETEKRKVLLPWVQDYFDGVADGIIVSGSISYGADYSVTPKSDIDLQIILNEAHLSELGALDLYAKDELTHAIDGYKRGLYKQFSLTGIKNGISIESHFWNQEAYLSAATFASGETLRLRSGIDTPSRDYGFAFDGTSDVVDYYGEMVDGYAVSVFPSYREKSGVLYLCRPITNILGLPLVLKSNDKIQHATRQCWDRAVQELERARTKATRPENLSIVNALPSQYKMSEASKTAVITKAQSVLSRDLQ